MTAALWPVFHKRHLDFVMNGANRDTAADLEKLLQTRAARNVAQAGPGLRVWHRA